MKLGIDVDGVLADFNSSYIHRVVAVTKRDLFPARPFTISTWNYPESYGYTKGEVSTVWESIKRDPQFWRDLPAYPETRTALHRLSGLGGAHDIYYITSRPGVQAKRQTETWLRDHGLRDRPTVLISSFKGLCARALELDRYVDDRDANVLDVALTSIPTRTYLVSRPWNAEFDAAGHKVVRVESVVEMLPEHVVSLDR